MNTKYKQIFVKACEKYVIFPLKMFVKQINKKLISLQFQNAHFLFGIKKLTIVMKL